MEDEQFAKEKQVLIDKAYEWIEEHTHDYDNGDTEFAICDWGSTRRFY